MCSSKKKSSFRIDDILHHQSDQNCVSTSCQTNHSLNNKISDVSISKSLLQDLSETNCVLSQCSIEQVQPRKPVPVYAQTVFDIQKSPLCYSVPIGMSHFQPAANYLEHYAQTMHKSKYQPRVYTLMTLDEQRICHLRLNYTVN